MLDFANTPQEPDKPSSKKQKIDETPINKASSFQAWFQRARHCAGSITTVSASPFSFHTLGETADADDVVNAATVAANAEGECIESACNPDIVEAVVESINDGATDDVHHDNNLPTFKS